MNAKLRQAAAEDLELSKAVFYVAWFDVSEEALDGLKGVERFYSHYLHSYEANTVWYDPALTNVENIEDALKDGAGYIGTVDENRNKGDKNLREGPYRGFKGSGFKVQGWLVRKFYPRISQIHADWP